MSQLQLICDKLDYSNALASINSRNSSKRLVVKSDIERRINDILKVQVVLSNELTIVSTNNYRRHQLRNEASADAAAEADITEWISARLLVRETLQDNTFLFPDFSASAEMRPFPEKPYFIKASFSRNSRIPTLNDMYWSPGGNPELRNENGYASEITWEMKNTLSESLNK